jgi:hypothetical protein
LGIVKHIHCARWANEVVADSRYDWMLPGVESRLREELAKLNVEADTEKTQRVDLACGDRLRIDSFELHLTSGNTASPQVKCKRLKKAEEHEQIEPEAKMRNGDRATLLKLRLRLLWRTPPVAKGNKPGEEWEDTAPTDNCAANETAHI